MLNHHIAPRVVLLLLIFSVCVSRCRAEDLKQAAEFLSFYCVNCHGAETAEGDLRLDQFDPQRWTNASLLEKIHAAIESGEMPPEDAVEHPEALQSATFQRILTDQLRVLGEK